MSTGEKQTPLLPKGILDASVRRAIAPPGQEGWREAPGWLFKKTSLEPPPRLRELWSLREILLIAQPPLLARRGNGSPDRCVKYVNALPKEGSFWSHFLATLSLIFLLPTLCGAQVISSSQHVLPWIVDGRLTPSAAIYRTEIVISNPNFSFANCSLQLGGLSARFETVNGLIAGPVFTLNFNVFPAGYEILRTTAAQPLATGYAVLNCTVDVYVTSRFALFPDINATLPTAEATVPSSFGSSVIEYVFDNRNGARLGIAIANPHPTAAVYSLTVGGSLNGVWYLTVPAGSVVTRFLDEWVPLPSNATGKVVISEYYSSRYVYSIGLKFSGQTFTSVFPNVRVP